LIKSPFLIINGHLEL